jgi:hypothetical protein
MVLTAPASIVAIRVVAPKLRALIYLTYGLLMMPPAVGLVELFRGARVTMQSSVVVLVILTIAARGNPCLALS